MQAKKPLSYFVTECVSKRQLDERTIMSGRAFPKKSGWGEDVDSKSKRAGERCRKRGCVC